MARKKKAPRLPARVRVATRADGTLRIVVISDTHSKPHPRTQELVAGLGPDVIFHGGDIGDLAVLAPFEAIAPVVAVRGNIDVRVHDLPDEVVVDVCRDDDVLFSVLLLHIAVYGPRLRADAARLAREVGASMVICGHSHVPFIGRDKGITVMNAGSCGPRRFQLPIVFGVVEIAPDGIALHHVDCETGARWEPPALSLR